MSHFFAPRPAPVSIPEDLDALIPRLEAGGRPEEWEAAERLALRRPETVVRHVRRRSRAAAALAERSMDEYEANGCADEVWRALVDHPELGTPTLLARARRAERRDAYRAILLSAIRGRKGDPFRLEEMGIAAARSRWFAGLTNALMYGMNPRVAEGLLGRPEPDPYRVPDEETVQFEETVRAALREYRNPRPDVRDYFQAPRAPA